MSRTRAWVAATSTVMAVTASNAHADLITCENLYVGRVYLERGQNLKSVVLLNNQTDASGSYWLYFDNWTADEKEAAVAMLMAAKLAGHRVHVGTDASGGCSISTNSQFVKSLTLANAP